jgi:HK97 family phage prohead protease
MTIDLSNELLRTYSFEIEGIELKREAGGDGREVTGIAVPYGVEQEICPGLIECFDRGSFAHQVKAIPQRTKFYLEHRAMGGVAIGKVRMAEERPNGLRLQMRVSDTQLGNDTLTYITDEVLEELSIGFIPRSNDKPDARGVTHRRKADLTEIALVDRGAYGRRAKVASVRSGLVIPAQDAALQALAALPLPDMIG